MKYFIRVLPKVLEGTRLAQPIGEPEPVDLPETPAMGAQIVIEDVKGPPRCFAVQTVEYWPRTNEVHLFCVEFPPQAPPPEGN